MPRINRACQFAPFDALKGLYNALKLKEYQNEGVFMGELSQEKCTEISNVLISLNNRDLIYLEYYSKSDFHYHKVSGEVFLKIEEGMIEIRNDCGKTTVDVCSISDIKKL